MVMVVVSWRSNDLGRRALPRRRLEDLRNTQCTPHSLTTHDFPSLIRPFPLHGAGAEFCIISLRRARRVASDMRGRKVRLHRAAHMAFFGYFLGMCVL